MTANEIFFECITLCFSEDVSHLLIQYQSVPAGQYPCLGNEDNAGLGESWLPSLTLVILSGYEGNTSTSLKHLPAARLNTHGNGFDGGEQSMDGKQLQ
jgi:hypothetical protein